MPIFGIFSFLFGILVITFPEFLAYLVGGFFLFIGLQIITFSILMRKSHQTNKSWSIGGYEIIRKK